MSSIANLPTGRRGQALAAVLVVVALLLLWQGVVVPLLNFYDNRTIELDLQQQQAAVMAHLAAEVPNLKRQVEAKGGSGPAPSLVVEGSSDAVAAAGLQDQLRNIATTSSTNLVSVENLPPEAANGAYHRIGLKISLNAHWPALIALLKAVEEASPPLLIDDVQIHGSPLPSLNNTRGLDASFAIYALRTGSIGGAGERKP